jgi:hypothetical protein
VLAARAAGSSNVDGNIDRPHSVPHSVFLPALTHLALTVCWLLVHCRARFWEVATNTIRPPAGASPYPPFTAFRCIARTINYQSPAQETLYRTRPPMPLRANTSR